MEKRRLGAGGPMVSALGIGAMSFAGIYGNATEEGSHKVLAAALDLGVDHIDTSNVYGMGRSEEIVGSFLARQGNARSKLFRIATKAGITKDPKSGARCYDNSPEHLERELEGSLKRLGVEAVDLFYVHRRDHAIPIEEVTGSLANIVAAGKARAFGFSEIAPYSLRQAARVHPVAAVQSEYSLATRAPDLGLVQTCAELGTALVAFSPVGRGMLTDRPPDAAAIRNSVFLSVNPRFLAPNLTVNLDSVDRFRSLAREMNASAASLAIAWLLAKNACVIPIPGTRSVDHLRQLAAGAELRLSDEDLNRIEACLPVGWTHGDRYTTEQWNGVERYS
jgi:aryl-alcohol dehydrogenase-like predicted oxidoreductase